MSTPLQERLSRRKKVIAVVGKSVQAAVGVVLALGLSWYLYMLVSHSLSVYEQDNVKAETGEGFVKWFAKSMAKDIWENGL